MSLVMAPSLSISHFNAPKWRIRHHHHHHCRSHPLTYAASCSLRRHHRRRRIPGLPHKLKPPPPSPSPDQNLQIVIDVRRLLDSSESRLDELVRSGNEALGDLKTLIAVDSDGRVVVSCRRSTIRFVGGLFLLSCVIALAAKLGLGLWGRLGFGSDSGVVRRRDRSLGGREVVVARSSTNTRNSSFRLLESPLAPARGMGTVSSKEMRRSGERRRRREEELPSWWPVSLPPPVVTDDKEKYQRIADRLIRAILDYRIRGNDILEDDIIQFRRLCRTSGVSVSIDTTNARDSFYRASVHFVLDSCGSAESQSSSVQIDGEDARQFIAGLADNIRLQNTCAARIVSAAVAARTRSCFLQAWALEMQGKHSEALVELSKICLIHQIFPPEECSPEMEMVARGLEKLLKVGEREFLMDMLVGVCGNGSHRSMAEALGLVPSLEGVYNEERNKSA